MSVTKLGLLVALALLVSTPAQSGERVASAPTNEQIAGWIRALDDEDYAVRETAGRELVAAGRLAIAPVAKVILSESPEAAWRANGVLEQIGVSGDEQTFNLVNQAFDEISKSHKHAAGKSTENLQNRWKLLRHERAVEQIAKLGGKVQGSAEGGGGMVFFGGGFGAMMPAIAIDEAVEIVEALPELEVPEVKHDEPALDEPAKADIPAPKVEFAERIDLGLLPGKYAVDLLKGLRKAKPLPLELPAMPAFEIGPAKGPVLPLPFFIPADIVPFDEPRKVVEPERPAGGLFGKVLKALRDVVPLGEFDAPAPPEVAEAIELAEPAGAIEFLPDAVEFVEVGMGVDFAGFSGDEIGGGVHAVHIGKDWKGAAKDFKLLKDVLRVASIELAEIEVTVDHIDQLSQLAELRQLNLQRCRFDRAAVEKLKKVRPELSVLTFGDAVLGISGEAQGMGFHVSFIAPNSGAQAAGIQIDDVITSIADEELRTFETLTHIIASHKAGDKVSVKFERQGKPQSVEVTLKTREASN